MLAADGLACDPNSGKATLYGVFDQVFAERFPTISPTFFLFIQLEGGDGNFSFRVQVRDPDNETFSIATETPGGLTSRPDLSMQVHVQVNPFTIAKPGIYKISAVVNETELSPQCEIRVRKKEKKT